MSSIQPHRNFLQQLRRKLTSSWWVVLSDSLVIFWVSSPCGQFGTNGVQHHQHNIREDLTSDGIDSEDDDHEDSEDDDHEDNWDEDEADQDDQDLEYVENQETLNDQISEMNSPKRKRTRMINSNNIPVEYRKLTSTTPITFKQFDELPIRARSKQIWNGLLRANPQFWKIKCQTWCLQLREAFEARNEVFVFLFYHPIQWRLIQMTLRLMLILVISSVWLTCFGSYAKLKKKFTAQKNGDLLSKYVILFQSDTF